MSARLSTGLEMSYAIREGARLEDCGREMNGSEWDLVSAMDEVDDLDLEVFAHAGGLEAVSEYRHALVEVAYEEAQREGMERWSQ